MQRVCKPDGSILLLEHGRSSWTWVGRYQDSHLQQMIEEGGCHWNREPQALVREAGLEILHAERAWLGIFHMITAAPGKTGST